jgi:hypothetical protein
MTDQEFDELRDMITRARNYGPGAVDAQTFRTQLKKAIDWINNPDEPKVLATAIVSGGEAGETYALPALTPGETAHIHLDPRLGSIQRQLLKLLREKGHWWVGCGWRWNTHKETEAILNSLVKRGYARKDGHKFFPTEPK